MRILFVEDDDGFRNLYTMVLENYIKNVEIFQCISGNQAIKQLKQKTFDLIICDFEMQDGNGDVVYSFLKENAINVNFILFSTITISKLGSFEEYMNVNPCSTYICKSEGVAKFKERIFSFLSKNFENISFIEELYKRIRIYHFWRFNRALCDVYLKLSDQKFVKIINKMDYYSKKDIDRYVRKKQKYFYISNEDYKNFSVSLKNASFLIFEEERILNYNKEELISTTHAIIHELLQTVGVSSTLLELAEKSVLEVTDGLRENNELWSLLVKSRDKRDYLYDHSYLLSCVCCNICSRLNWYNQETLHKLCMAAVFHDLLLNDSKLAMINRLDDERLLEFSKEEQNLFADHPLKMAEIIRNSGKFISNVDVVIEQHHERPDGKGFPRGLSHLRISQLVCVFIIAHDFVDRLYEIDFDEEKLNIVLSDLGEMYNVGNFRKPLEALVEGYRM